MALTRVGRTKRRKTTNLSAEDVTGRREQLGNNEAEIETVAARIKADQARLRKLLRDRARLYPEVVWAEAVTEDQVDIYYDDETGEAVEMITGTEEVVRRRPAEPSEVPVVPRERE